MTDGSDHLPITKGVKRLRTGNSRSEMILAVPMSADVKAALTLSVSGWFGTSSAMTSRHLAKPDDRTPPDRS
jgi:hypothetical protein